LLSSIFIISKPGSGKGDVGSVSDGMEGGARGELNGELKGELEEGAAVVGICKLPALLLFMTACTP
jgi:hypothetical protein